ncbi:astacin [Necator americanus]|uniref:Metalloendopeptidase n=1 Tax=Necator americanus TaxID=51031 RepID=W2SFZ9_NECAM|nr:astacin [Necator americanus]ETN68549.1 astacin [Necator americanus]
MRVLLLSILLIACTCAKKDKANVSNETLLEVKMLPEKNMTTHYSNIKVFQNLNVMRIVEIYQQFKAKKQQEAFRKAVNAWSNNTCVDFFEDDKAEDRVVVARSYFCSSFVGKIGGEQAIYQAPYCDHFRGAAHALGHVLGLLHPMSREDRDEHITVKGENILSPEETRIEIKIISFGNKTKAVFCNEAGVEIKTNKDPALTGYRFCSNEDAHTLISSSNLVPVITYNRRADESTVALKYRYVKAKGSMKSLPNGKGKM